MTHGEELARSGGTQLPRRTSRLIMCLCAAVAVAGCARHYTADSIADPYGFFSGIWHGLVFPLALLTNLASWLLSLFGLSFLSSIELVGRPNTGFFFYYIGFILGLSSYGSASAR